MASREYTTVIQNSTYLALKKLRKFSYGLKRMCHSHKKQHILCFKKAKKIFIWLGENALSLPKIVHIQLQKCQQKQRSFALEHQKVIKDKVDKLLQVNFIHEVSYPKQLTNVVLVKKANGKWCVCIDYTDLLRHAQKIAILAPDHPIGGCYLGPSTPLIHGTFSSITRFAWHPRMRRKLPLLVTKVFLVIKCLLA